MKGVNGMINHGKIVQVVKMDAEEISRYKQIFDYKDAVGRILQELTDRTLKENFENIELLWGMIAKKFGYESLQDVSYDGKEMIIHWTIGSVVLRERNVHEKEIDKEVIEFMKNKGE